MSEKVVLTQEQAKALELLKRHWSDDEILARSVKGRVFGQPYNDCYKRLEEMDLFILTRALERGYEVELEFKVGDWIIAKSEHVGNVPHIVTAMYKDKGRTFMKFDDLKKGGFRDRLYRLATNEEISGEKERRWWKSHNRDVWEIKEDDILEYLGDLYIVDCFDSEKVYLKSGIERKSNYAEPFGFVKKHFKVVCFAKDRKDV